MKNTLYFSSSFEETRLRLITADMTTPPYHTRYSGVRFFEAVLSRIQHKISSSSFILY